MRIAVMQPYLFPYLGYFQLIHSVDTFILLDDVAYVNRGWINRNRILVSGNPHTFTLPLSGASQNRRICDLTVAATYHRWRGKFLTTLRYAYSRAPFSELGIQSVEKALATESLPLVPLLANTIHFLMMLFNTNRKVLLSSEVPHSNELTGQDRILGICRALDAETYVNLPGGKELYSRKTFAASGVELCFLSSSLVQYPQWGGNTFEPNLSIIDHMMFCSPSDLSEQMGQYTLVTE